MALQFVVEDGSGVSGATSYVAEADADQYFENRPHHTLASIWSAASSAQKQGALVEATAWLDITYVWKGLKVDETYALDWPRSSVYDAEGYAIDIDEIPERLKQAACEAAVRILNSEDMAPDSDAPVDSVSLGPLSVDFLEGGTQSKKYTVVDRLLRGLIEAGGMRKVIRG